MVRAVVSVRTKTIRSGTTVHANSIGFSGADFGFESMALSGRAKLRAYFFGQDVALGVIGVPLLTVISFGLAAGVNHLKKRPNEAPMAILRVGGNRFRTTNTERNTLIGPGLLPQAGGGHHDRGYPLCLRLCGVLQNCRRCH